MPHSSLQNVLRYARRMAEAGQGSPSSDADLLNHFSIHHDDGSFAVLVERHGSVVWGVCRRVLNVVQDAEDCFQAAFLVLARKAHTLQKGESLGAWLHRVAYRLALRSQAMTARRRTEEGRAAAMNPVTSEREESWKELRGLLDRELEHLSEIYRVPLVLCYLEGKSNVQAAKELGWPLGTVKGRIIRGRELLRKRLENRGLTLTAVALAALLSEQAAKAAVPGMLLMSTTSAATSFALGQAVIASGRALVLANELLRAATLGTLIKSALVMIALSLTIGGGALLADPARVDERAQGKSGIPVADTRSLPKHSEKPKTPPEHLDLAGDPLPADAICRLGSTRFRHGFPIRSLRVTPDGKHIISESSDGIRRWDLHTGKQVQAHAWETDGFRWPNWAPDISSDGELAFISVGTGIESYDMQTGAKLSTFGRGRYHRAFVSPNGNHVAALSLEEHFPVELFDAHTGKSIWRSGYYDHPMAKVNFTSDGKTMVVAGWSMLRSPPLPGNSLRIVDIETGAERLAIDLGETQPQEIAVSPDGTLVSAICQLAVNEPSGVADVIRISDLATGKEKLRIEPPPPVSKITSRRTFSAMLFPRGDNILLTAGNSEELILWDLTTGKEQRRLGNGLGNAAALAITPDGKTLVAGMRQGIRVLDFNTGRDVSSLVNASPNAIATSFSSNGATIATAGSLGENGGSQTTYWDAATGEELRRVAIPDGYVCGFANGGASALVEGWPKSKNLLLRDLGKGSERPLPANYAGGMLNIYATSADGKYIVMGDIEKDVIELFDCQTGDAVRSFSDTDLNLRYLRFTEDAKQLFAFSLDGTVRIWNRDSAKKIGQYTLPAIPDNRPRVVAPQPAMPATVSQQYPSYRIALSPNGKCIASTDSRKFILLSDAADGRNSRRVDVGEVRPNIMAFSPNSKLLVWATMDDPMIHLLDLVSCKEVKQLPGHRGIVFSFTFSSDGQQLVSSNSDGTSLVWDFGRIVKGLH